VAPDLKFPESDGSANDVFRQFRALKPPGIDGARGVIDRAVRGTRSAVHCTGTTHSRNCAFTLDSERDALTP
jgi:hypothetical protein